MWIALSGSMLNRFLLSAGLIVLVAGACAPPPPELAPGTMALEEGPDGIPAEAWTNALAAHRFAVLEGQTASQLLTIIDYTRPATERRLWVVDVGTRTVLANEFVAHGQRSGGLLPTRFSNRDGTHQSSLGTFITAPSPYIGIKGISLRLRGLEPGINDNAWTRGIVIHGTSGVSEARAKQGSQGRTEGCPAVPKAAARKLIRLIENGVVVFMWYPDRSFLERSEYVERGTAIRASSLE